MEERIIKLLKDYGLNDKEIKIYLFLVGEIETTAYKIAKGTRIHKSTCYDILDKLIVKGFVSEVEIEGKKFYSALEVKQTLTKLKDRENILTALLPEIEKVQKKKLSKVSVFESKESQKQFNLKLLEKIKKGEINELNLLSGGPSGFVNFNEPLEQESSQIFLENILKEIKKSKLFKNKDYKGIWNSKFMDSSLLRLLSDFGENRFLEDLPTKATIVLYNNTIAFLYTLDSIPQLIEIDNALIAEEMKSYFNLLWKLAKK